MKLIVGLGNPGKDHEGHRHNVGFMVADAIIARHHLGPVRRRFQGEVAEGRLGREKVLVLKPATYMNESGRSVGEAARFYKLTTDDIVVIHDELDLAAGKVRVKKGGGVAGHNGLRSIAKHLGPDFVRVRIGIGHPGDKRRVTGHVLGNFAKSDHQWLDPLVESLADSAPLLADGENANVMNAAARAVQGDPVSADKATPAHAKPRAPAKRKSAGPRQESAQSSGPSQRDLARHGTRPATSRAKRAGQSKQPAPTTPPQPAPVPEKTDRKDGPLAGMLKRWLGSSGD